MAQEQKTKQELVSYFLEREILLSEDALAALHEGAKKAEVAALLREQADKGILHLSRDVLQLLGKGTVGNANWHDLETSRAMLENGRNKTLYHRFLEHLTEPDKHTAPLKVEDLPKVSFPQVRIITSHDEAPAKRSVADFVGYFTQRYKKLEAMLRGRPEVQSAMSISKVLLRKDKGTVSVIGMVTRKEETKNGNIIFTLEDTTGSVKVHVSQTKEDIYTLARQIVPDEVIAVVGTNQGSIIFSNKIMQPDLPASHEFRKSPDETYALFLSDLHVGSKEFLEDDLLRFIQWIQGKTGSDAQRQLAKKAKYLFIVGDLIDGVGIYPGQENDLAIPDVCGQYAACARFIAQIPQRIKIIICPGNHDAVRLAEPQPVLDKGFAKPLYELPNVTMVSNPSVVNIHASEGFSGFDVLLYHGYSFDYYVANVDALRNAGGYDRADLIMKFMLKRRHLAPTHASTLYIPDCRQDALVIDRVPDIFATGHIHKSIAANYCATTMICGSCWQAKTAYQEKVGHHPEPSRVPIINLQTREVKILRFGKE